MTEGHTETTRGRGPLVIIAVLSVVVIGGLALTLGGLDEAPAAQTNAYETDPGMTRVGETATGTAIVTQDGVTTASDGLIEGSSEAADLTTVQPLDAEDGDAAMGAGPRTQELRENLEAQQDG